MPNKRNRSLTLILTAFCILNFEPLIFSADSFQQTGHFTKIIPTTVTLDYLVHIPKDVSQVISGKYPAILFLHGSGERGTNVWDVAKHGPPHLIQESNDLPFIVISPQCPPGQQWQADALLELIAEMKKKYPIDPDRLYITGLSMGGYGTWDLAIHHPTLFAAAVPICGRGDTNALAYLGQERLENLKKLPIWAFHGAKDPAVPVKGSQDIVNALHALGGRAELTIYPEVEHNSWTQTYANPEVFKWLLSHDRKSNGFKKPLE